MEIKRPLYLQQLIDNMGNGMIKVVTGMRRCGKSFLLFTLFYRYLLEQGVLRNHIIELALDDIGSEGLREPHALYQYIKSHLGEEGTYYVLIDEIQFADRFAEVLNSLLHLPNVDVYVTGSNSHFLSTDVLTEFRGRGQEIRLYPLSFAEFYSARTDDVAAAWQDYLVYGGLPMLFQLKTDKARRDYLLNLFRETYLKDIQDRYTIRQPQEMDELVRILASSVGSLTNPSKLQRTFKSSRNSTIRDKTITQYMSYLRDAFLVDSALRYDIKGKKYINTPLKFYFTDVGLRNALLNFRQIEETHLMENIIFNELKSRGYGVDVGIVETRPVDASGKRQRVTLEIDFIAHEGSRKYYIQSAFALPDEDKKAQEERPLLAVDDSFKKIIIVAQPIKVRRDERGIMTMGIYDFLLQQDSLEQ